MASERQIAANRENAKHCTGPRSEAGKAKSSQNAFKTGIDAKSEVMACENPAEHDELIASFRTFYMRALSGDCVEYLWGAYPYHGGSTTGSGCLTPMIG